MHLKLLFTSLTLAAFVCTQAQNTSPYWSLAGNSTATTSSKLGTTNTVDLKLYTNNSARLTILGSNGYVGIGTTAPTSRFTINTATGTSPLRVSVNGSTKLYMSSGGGLSIGSGSSAPANGLYVVGNVGIGTAAPTQKLHVVGTIYGTSSTADGVSGQSTASEGTGVRGTGYHGIDGYGTYIGVFGTASSYGGYGVIGSGTVGVLATSSADLGNGVHSEAFGNSAYGINAYSRLSYGIYSRTANSSSYAGYFVGNVYTSGSYQPSARNLKQNITELSSAMALVSKLQPKEYEYKQEGTYGMMNLPKGKRYGLIAEELEEVLPGLVKATTFEKRMSERIDAAGNRQVMATEDIEFKAVNYTELIPIIVKGMQEQQAENQALKDRVAKLEELILELKNGRAGSVNVTSSYLEQNTPNPVSGITTIRYQVPETATSAKLTLTNAKGQLIKTIGLGNRGAGQLNLNTSSLAAGTYNYTLYVDGKQADAKRLVIAR